MKKYFSVLAILVLTLMTLAFVGCGGQEAETDAEQESVTDVEYVRLSDPDAAALASKGYELYVHVASGGDFDGGMASQQIIDGMDYRQLGSDIDTMAKLEAYLGQAFTSESIGYFLESASIKEVDGVLYQPNADGGSILDWSQATAILYIDDIEAAQFDVSVPSSADDAPETTTIRINYAKDGDTWKIASNPAEIY